MSPEEAIFAAAIAFVGAPSALRISAGPGSPLRVRNATALALVATWVACRLIYALTGEGMPVQAMMLSDMAVIASMYLKKDWRDCSPYRSLRHQFCALWLERSPWDRAILALFPVAWIFYFPIVGARTQFWTLWSLGLAQLFLVGWESLQPLLNAPSKPSRADAPDDYRLRFNAPVREPRYG